MTEVDARAGTSGSTSLLELRPLSQARRAPEELGQVAEAALRDGLRRIEVVAWRDLDDPESGGSELHVHEVARRWASAGLEVVLRTSAVKGAPSDVRRCGYRAVRRWGRYAVFPATAARSLGSAGRGADGLVEVWNGMPFFSPLWRRRSRIVFLHHVHAEMWRMVLSPGLARLGESVEKRMAPPLYRGTPVVTLSESSRREIEAMLGLRRVQVVAPGVDPSFTPGPGRSPHPLVLAVGRLVPVKALPLLVDVLAEVRLAVPGLRARFVGEGYGRRDLEAAIRRAGASEWIELVGRCSTQDLVEHYRSAWLLASASRREGWGMTVTEAAACATPAVVSAIPGHEDAVLEGVSGMLCSGADEMVAAVTKVLTDRVLRQRLSRGALARASALSWEATAAGTLGVLLDEHRRTLRPPRPPAAPGGPDPRPRRARAPAR